MPRETRRIKIQREDDESYDMLCDRVTDYIDYVIEN